MDTLHMLSFLLCGLISCEDITYDASHSPSDPVAPYYPEDNSQYYPDYGYPSQPSYPESSFSSTLDRQGLETVLGAPLVITAFVAALLGGFLSPLISSGLSRLGEYEIMWPEVKRKIPSIGTPEDEARTLESWSWIQALEKINHALQEPRTKRSSSDTFNKFLRR
eukprot:TRINITY_DN12455_c0_g1_i8.p1 TRINITY_DN12455_c0_g1~~TRINITY_DN12455_c0_g1_i8.p1  ORF type:complete len:165 (-),score=35.68 TRINITY_DN12455_c0_g1_i8:600-1094(-)